MNHIASIVDLNNIRIDARKLNEYRIVSLTFTSPGSVKVKIGESEALGECTVTAVAP